MSYQAIRNQLEEIEGQAGNAISDRDKALLDAFRQLTLVLESDLAQIKGALSHVARLLEEGRRP